MKDKVETVLSVAPCRVGPLGDCKYSFASSYPWYWIKMNGQLHALGAFHLSKYIGG